MKLYFDAWLIMCAAAGIVIAAFEIRRSVPGAGRHAAFMWGCVAMLAWLTLVGAVVRNRMELSVNTSIIRDNSNKTVQNIDLLQQHHKLLENLKKRHEERVREQEAKATK